MAAYEDDKAGIPDDGIAGGSHPRTLQLLRSKWEFPRNSEFLEVFKIRHLPYAEQTSPEAIHEIQQVSAYLELLREGTARDNEHLGLETKECLKSRMRENCTSGSVRGSRQAFHVYKYPERSVETVYSTAAHGIQRCVYRFTEKAELSQNEVAEKIFVTRQAVSRWERGETVPEAETLLWHCPGCSEFPLTPCLAAPERWCVRAAECR